MRILVIGSLNYDYIYNVDHITKDSETNSAYALEKKIGGKGLNQAIALARAGADVLMLGCVGLDGDILINELKSFGVNTKYIHKVNEASGHAIIQLANDGTNAIVIYGGANLLISEAMVDEALDELDRGDYVLVQNETSCVSYIIDEANKRGLKVIFNPSPISKELFTYPIELVDILILNELEAKALIDRECDDRESIRLLKKKYPNTKIVLTLGDRGVMYLDDTFIALEAQKDIDIVDTTGAGDTFAGFYIASIMKGYDVTSSLDIANRASAIAIGRLGASCSIPSIAEVKEFRKKG